MFKPIVLTRVALIRAFRRYANQMGLSDLMGDVTAQVFEEADREFVLEKLEKSFII